MLETLNLTKVYKPKRGVPVKALDSVSIRFPEKGMVFLLGKSGSGKSTLLNVLGGLDRYNGGEIIIKGVSSKKFKQKHFDSYRNTYIGFIFQEYNILDEFSVGANVALALQLQGRKATDEEINRILRDVDLEGYGNRKPNELSGGQKQRVAIARALVKNPQIIMADEPTGALDSVTGKQVLDTLKKLSAEKLVIVVSHDREFAEKYADRIIELADGKVISDVEFVGEASDEAVTQAISFSGNTVTIPEKYHLTAEDMAQINAYIDSLQGGAVSLSFSGKTATAGGRQSRPTDQSKISLSRDNGFKLIKSRLPMKYAFKMGGSSLKYKKVRLVFTCLLSCIAFGLFGLADTFSAFNYVTTSTNSIMDSKINYASVIKSVKIYYNDTEDEFYYDAYNHYISNDDINEIYQNTGVKLGGVYSENSYGNISIWDYLGDDTNSGYSYGSVYSDYFRGYGTMDEAILNASDMKLVAGRLPNGAENEIAISAYMVEIFKKRGYKDYDGLLNAENENREDIEIDYELYNKAIEIISAEDMLGKTIFGNKIVGIIDTGLDISRYEGIYDLDETDSTADMLLYYALQQEFSSLRDYSLACVIMVGDGYIDRLIGAAENETVFTGYTAFRSDDGMLDYSLESIINSSALDMSKVIWVKEPLERIDGKQIILPYSMAQDILWMLPEPEPDYNPDGSYEETPEEQRIIQGFAQLNFMLEYEKINNGNYYEQTSEDGYTVVGIYDDRDLMSSRRSIYVSKTLFEQLKVKRDGDYIFAVAAMPTDYDTVEKLVAYGDSDTDVRFNLQNPVVYEIDTLRGVFETLAPIFLYIGIGFALFASLMLSNFISTSITYKKREIGILRAIGSRGNDVFRIFFSESFIIAMINFVLTTAGLFAITMLINTSVRNDVGLLITVLHFGVRQIGLELGVSLLVAFIASFIPVKRIASKKPIDAIRDR